jgi:DNA-binding CsgD family transcriptional regulator
MTARVAIRSDHLQLYQACNIQAPASDRYLATFDLDADNILIGCNAVGQHMLDRGNILLGSLRNPITWASRELEQKMSAALQERAGDVLLVSVTDTTGARHAILVARETGLGTFRASSRTRMVVRDLLAWAESEILVPSRVYLLTASETALAQSLVIGRSLTMHATLRGSVVATVRKQLSAIFAKTGTSRQVELVATLLATAALHDPWATESAPQTFTPTASPDRSLTRRSATRISH